MKEKKAGSDPRYVITGKLMKGGFIKSFHAIFDTIPKSVVAKDFGIHVTIMNKRLAAPENFTIGQIINLSKWMKVDFITLAEFWSKASKKSMRKVK